jgi:hypothetical protein
MPRMARDNELGLSTHYGRGGRPDTDQCSTGRATTGPAEIVSLDGLRARKHDRAGGVVHGHQKAA